MISEVEHFLIFRLQLETDIARIKEILPGKYADMGIHAAIAASIPIIPDRSSFSRPIRI